MFSKKGIHKKTSFSGLIALKRCYTKDTCFGIVLGHCQLSLINYLDAELDKTDN